MAQYSTDFTEYTVGTEPTGWVDEDGGYLTGLFTVEEQVEGTGGRVLRRNPIGTNSASFIWQQTKDGEANTRVQILARLRRISGSDKWISLVGSNYAGIRNVSNQLRVLFESDTAVDFPITAGEWFWLRLTEDAVGTQIEGWYDGQDPATEAVSTYDTINKGAGRAGLGTYSSAEIEWDYFAVGTGSDDAPFPDDQYFTRFDGETVGQASDHWTEEPWSPASVNNTVVERGGTNTLNLALAAGDGRAYTKYLPVQDTAEVELLYRTRALSSGANGLDCYVQGQDNGASYDAYKISVRGGSDQDINVIKYIANTPTTLGTVATTIESDAWLWVRVKRSASAGTIQVKAWHGALDAEPVAWNLEITGETSLTDPGSVGLFHYSFETLVDCFAVGLNGASAEYLPRKPNQAFLDFTAETVGAYPNDFEEADGNTTGYFEKAVYDSTDCLAVRASAAVPRSIRLTAIPASDSSMEFTARLAMTNVGGVGNTDFGIAFGDRDNERRIQFDFAVANQLRVFLLGVSASTVATASYTPPGNDVWFRIRGYYNPTTGDVKFKYWLDSVSEPATWDIEDNTVITEFAPECLFVTSFENDDVYIDYIHVAGPTGVALARFKLDEAATGTTPTTAVDDTGNGNTLTLDYSSGDMVWTTNTEGRGLDFLAAPISTDSAVARLDDIATNGNLGAELANTKTLWAVMVLQNIEGTASGARVLALGTSSGNTDFSVVKVDGDQWYVRWDQEAGGGNYQGDFYQAMTTDQPMVMVVQVNTESAVAEDRLKVWIDGQPRTISTNNIPQDATLSLVNDTDRILTVGNRGSQNRNMKGQVFYAELGTGVLSDVQVASIYSGLSANNDAAWVEGQTPSAPQVIALVEGQSLTQTELVSLAAFMVPGTVSAQQLVQGSPVEIGQASAQAVSAVVAQQVVQSQTASISTITSAILGLTQQITSAETLDTTTKAQAITAVIEQVTQADALSLTEVQNVLSVVAQQLTQTEVAVIDQGGQALVAATLEQVSQSQVLSVAQIATVTGVLAESQVQANTATVAATYTMNTVTLEQLTQAELIALTYGDGLTVVAVEQTTDFVLPPLTVTMFGAPEMLEAEQLTEGVSPLTAAVMVVTCADIEQITEAEIADVIGTAKQLNPRSLRVNRTTIGYTVNRKSTGFTVTLKTTS